MNNSPIGIFDSGIGGLTVASALNQLLPNEQIIYFGDTAHLPYGDKSKASIQKYAHQISHFLMAQNVKMIVIACNTASALAYDTVLECVENKIPVVNVIDPVVNYVVEHKTNVKKLGVIGTKATITSGIYAQKINSMLPALEIAALATPLLAPMIEEGFFNNSISNSIINNYLNNSILNNISHLVLGCTHYPLIQKEISAHYHNTVEVLDTAYIVANYIKTSLMYKNGFSDIASPQHKFFVSDYTQGFERSTRIFFGSTIHLEFYPMWS